MVECEQFWTTNAAELLSQDGEREIWKLTKCRSCYLPVRFQPSVPTYGDHRRLRRTSRPTIHIARVEVILVMLIERLDLGGGSV
jgi:hypothetical protein